MADLSKLTRDQAVALRDALDLVGTAADSHLSRVVFHSYIQTDKIALDWAIANSSPSTTNWKQPAQPQPRVLWGEVV